MTSTFESPTSLYDFVVRDGNGVKGLMDLGLPKVPHKYIQPPHERIRDPDSTPVLQVAPIDLSKLDGSAFERAQVVAQIDSASQTLGFFQVVNHGVPLDLLDKLTEVAHKFFSLTPEKKVTYRGGGGSLSQRLNVKYGTSFVPEKEEALEWKDYVSMGYTNDEDALQYWPHVCKNESLEYLKLSTKMAKKILEILISNLGAKLEDSKIEGLLDFRMVNMNYYPACPNPELTVGVGRHSDMGTLTVLLQDGIGGLYVKLEQDSEAGNRGDWVQIPPIQGALVINIGDTLQILSNGRYKSAEHRVRTTSSQCRVSIPVFTIAKPTEKIGPLPEVVKKDGFARYREIEFKDYMNNFFGNAHDGKKSLDFASIEYAPHP